VSPALEVRRDAIRRQVDELKARRAQCLEKGHQALEFSALRPRAWCAHCQTLLNVEELLLVEAP
jgi:hypothetical protein